MGTFIDIVVPTDQREGTESKIGRWLKREGDAVAENEPLLEIHTDKVTLEVAAPKGGILKTILKREGEEVDLTEPLGTIEIGQSERAERSSVQTERAAAPRVPSPEGLSPAARSLAKELGVDPSTVTGTGKDGRVTAKDIESAAGRSGPPALTSERRPHSPMRKSIAARMTESVSKAPHVTAVFEADFSAILADKAGREKEFKDHGVKLTLSAYIVRAAAAALRAVPEVNSRWHDEYLEVLREIHIGFAAAVDDSQGAGAGLLLPVIRNADGRSLLEIARELSRLTDLARGGRLQQQDTSGATFSISNHGMGGSLLAAPIIIPQPQSAILGVGKLEKRPYVSERDGKAEILVRPSAYVTLTIDHRALDGFTANRFLAAFTDALTG